MAKRIEPAAQRAPKAIQTGPAEKIYLDLKAKILTRELIRGDKLPTEKVLMSTHGVSISTVREAMRALAMTHLIEVRHGSGAYVTADTDQLISASLGSTMQIEQLNVAQVLTVYGALNVLAIEQAAHHATSEDLVAMRTGLERITSAKNSQSIDDGIKLFSNAVALASKNPLLAALCRSLAEVQLALATELLGTSYKVRKDATGKLAVHRKTVVEAIQTRDAVAARGAALAYHNRTAEVIMSLPRVIPVQPGTSALSSLLASLLRR